MKVRATGISKQYHIPIREAGGIVAAGTEFDVTPKRFLYLTQGPLHLVLVEEVVEEPVIEEPVVEEVKPKRRGRKKNESTSD